MSTTNIILTLTMLATALITGLFYGYSCSVNLGLAKLSDEAYVAAMQSINRAIQNPLFFASFFGTLILLPLSAYLNYNADNNTRFYFLLAASIIYALGVFGVTVMGNVPLNNALETFDMKAGSMLTIKGARDAFENAWNRLHAIRTAASIVALTLVIWSCIISHASKA